MTQYIATLRAVFDAESDVEAYLIAEQVRENGERDLEIEEDDSLDITQVTSNPLEVSPEETLVVLRRARNQLIRTKVRWAVDMARELDRAIWILKHRAEAEVDYAPPYPVSSFIDLVRAIIQKKENPLD
jgi:hypothetical protein